MFSLPARAKLDTSSRAFLWFNAVSAYAGWFLCVASAGTGFREEALTLVAAIVSLNVAWHRQRSLELGLVLLVATIGTLLDTGLIHAGVYSPVGFEGGLCPFWITMLWANFATTLRGSLRWLQDRWLASMLLGGIGGPLSYGAAARLHAAQIHEPVWLGYAVLAGAWAVVLPAVFLLVRHVSRGSAIAAVVAIGALLPQGTRAAQLAGVSFPERVEVHGVSLDLRGIGLLRYRVLFKGYVAALYLPAATPAAKVLEDTPKRLEIHYFWSIPARAFGDAANALLARNFPPEVLQPLRERIELLHRCYEDVKPGDRYALTYIPSVGTELALNGVVRCRIPGADFATAYFAIWLGRHPIDADLKQALLGIAAR